MAGDGQPGLPPFQLEVARIFFALPASRGFLLARGAALLARHLTARPRRGIAFRHRRRKSFPSARRAGYVFSHEMAVGPRDGFRVRQARGSA